MKKSVQKSIMMVKREAKVNHTRWIPHLASRELCMGVLTTAPRLEMRASASLPGADIPPETVLTILKPPVPLW